MISIGDHTYLSLIWEIIVLSISEKSYSASPSTIFNAPIQIHSLSHSFRVKCNKVKASLLVNNIYTNSSISAA